MPVKHSTTVSAGDLITSAGWNADHILTDLLPLTTGAYSIGSPTLKWLNAYIETIFAGDLVLSKGWRISEEEDGIYVYKAGRKYKIKLEEVPVDEA